MENLKEQARNLLNSFKGDKYVFGLDCLERIGALTAGLGKKCLLVTNLGNWSPAELQKITGSLNKAGVDVTGPISGVAPNAPREDVERLKEEIDQGEYDCLVVIGGGSDIDAVKAAAVLSGLGGDVDDYFGVNKVSEKLKATGSDILPVVAVQTAASSAAHLTKYSNITDIASGQKKLIVDEAVVPPKALFDYGMTTTMPPDFTLDGALDGIAHSLEVFYGIPDEKYAQVTEIAEVCIELIVSNLEKAVADGTDLETREALGLGTDLGGYAIMVGGTNGGHLTSFSLVDVLSHGRACAIMNPYYTVFFGPAIQPQLRILSKLYAKHGYIRTDTDKLQGRDLALAVAEAMIKLAQKVNFPTTLNEVPQFNEQHIKRALTAAKNPQLEMKLKNMPVPLTGEMIDDYMGPILQSASSGDFSLIKNVSS